MEGRDATREPCPDRIVEDMGGAYGMGCVGGFLWHFMKGARNSPRGVIFQNAFYSARSRAPVLGGNFAVWGGTFSTYDCIFQAYRGKEDHWNAIGSGFATGGTLALRGGMGHAVRNALIGGVLLSKFTPVTSPICTRKPCVYQCDPGYSEFMRSFALLSDFQYEFDKKTIVSNTTQV